MDTYDVAIVGAGPGGLACAIKAKEMGLSYVVLEKGESILQGIIDSYPKGKKVYPTIPRGQSGPFPVEDLEPSNEPVEEYVAKVKSCVEKQEISVHLGEDVNNLVREEKVFKLVTSQTQYECSNVVLAFGRSIPADLGVYGDAKMVHRRLGNPEEHIGTSSLVMGGGNSAADIVAALSKAKRTAGDDTPVFWAHRREQFRVDKEVARDLGEEILLGGNIRILQGAVPVIGEVDEDGVDRLIIRLRIIDVDDGMKFHQGLSFPMSQVIACVGTQGPAPVFEQLGLEQVSSDEAGRKARKSGKAGTRLIVLNPGFQASTEGIYAIGAAISPAYAAIGEDGALERKKHTDLIFTAIRDGVQAMEHIARRNR
ncbi:MAG: NAD(P)-binding domain-containing protein [Deltaproteobacteria bacterium]|nr:NAD(P)-binding domain-containing protein [Deltaproteobacteria bacterium]